LIELPVDLSTDVLDRLSGTRISGKLIALRRDGGPLRRTASDGAARKPRY
jgi:ATP-dependent RNA helicase DeaD